MPASDSQDPLLVTALLDEASFAFFDTVRREHYPAALNVVPAHVMLFHHLPGGAAAEIEEIVERLCHDHALIELAVVGVQLLGRGVAYQMNAPALSVLHDALAARWTDWLTLQDRQVYRPHIVIQNKVTFEAARELCEALSARFKPFQAMAAGLSLWRYRNGPWDKVRDFPFAAETESVGAGPL